MGKQKRIRKLKNSDCTLILPGQKSFDKHVAYTIKVMLPDGCWNDTVDIAEVRTTSSEVIRYLEAYNLITDEHIVMNNAKTTLVLRFLGFSDLGDLPRSGMARRDLLDFFVKKLDQCFRHDIKNAPQYSKTKFNIGNIRTFFDIIYDHCQGQLG